MSGAHVPDVHVAKKIKCENPFPNWKPITRISYIELDIIVSRLVVYEVKYPPRKVDKGCPNISKQQC